MRNTQFFWILELPTNDYGFDRFGFWVNAGSKAIHLEIFGPINAVSMFQKFNLQLQECKTKGHLKCDATHDAIRYMISQYDSAKERNSNVCFCDEKDHRYFNVPGYPARDVHAGASVSDGGGTALASSSADIWGPGLSVDIFRKSECSDSSSADESENGESEEVERIATLPVTTVGLINANLGSVDAWLNSDQLAAIERLKSVLPLGVTATEMRNYFLQVDSVSPKMLKGDVTTTLVKLGVPYDSATHNDKLRRLLSAATTHYRDHRDGNKRKNAE